jgi:serine/threonine-protein kinase
LIGGKYRVEGFIGSGGMGVVVAARAVADDRRVAIKCLAREALENTELFERFSREARVFERLQSKHVVRTLDVGVTDDGRPFIVFEHLEGIDLERHLAMRGPLPLGEAARYVVEACEALGEAHAANIVHRDLKPSNLFLAKQPDGSTIIKVLDFGVSKLADDPVTKTRSMLGTANYMSPEQLQSSRRVDHRADIWALGVLLYELLTACSPFIGNTLIAIMDSIKANKPHPIRALRPELPEAIEDLLGRCLRTNRDERYDSVRALVADLEALVERENQAPRDAPSPLESGPLDEWPRRPSEGKVRIAADIHEGSPNPPEPSKAASPLPSETRPFSVHQPRPSVVRQTSALQYLNYAIGAAAVLAAYVILRPSSPAEPAPFPTPPASTAPLDSVPDAAAPMGR